MPMKWRVLWWLAAALLTAPMTAAAAAVGAQQPQLGPVPSLVPGLLRQGQPPMEAVTMLTWASLKKAMNQIGSQVKEVLTVRRDLAMLQEDLLQQEQSWHTAESDLQAELDGLQARAGHLEELAGEGAHLKEDEKALRESIDKERAQTYTLKQLYSYEQAQAQLEEKQLQIRVGELRVRLARVKAADEDAVQKARCVEVDESGKVAALEREAAAMEDKVTDEEAALKVQEGVAQDQRHDLEGRIQNMQAVMVRAKAQLRPPAQLENEVAALKAHLQQEVKGVAETRSMKVQLASACEGKRQQAIGVLKSEKAKLRMRRQQTARVCDRAEQQRVLLEAIMQEACAKVPEVPEVPTEPAANAPQEAPFPENAAPPPAPAPAAMLSSQIVGGGPDSVS